MFMSHSTSIRQFPAIGRNVCFMARFDECLIKPCIGTNVRGDRFDFSKNNKVYFFFHRPGTGSVDVYISRSRELILLDGWIVKWAPDIVPTDIKPIGNAARISETHLKSRYY